MLKTVKQRVIAASILAYLFLLSVASLMGYFLGVENFDGVEVYGFKGMILWLIILHSCFIGAAALCGVLFLVMNWIFDGEKNESSSGTGSDTGGSRRERRAYIVAQQSPDTGVHSVPGSGNA